MSNTTQTTTKLTNDEAREMRRLSKKWDNGRASTNDVRRFLALEAKAAA